MIGSGLVLTDAFWIERFFIETREYYLGSATKDTTNLKLVQISDLHLQSVNHQLKQLAKKLNKLQPDLILITGDAIDKAKKIHLLDEFLSLVDKSVKKVAILGNWEYWGAVDLDELKKIYTNNNCRLLINETIQFTVRDKTISITGY